MNPQNITAIDFETTPVGYFDRKSKKNHAGHPRNATATHMSQSNGITSEVFESNKVELVKPGIETIIFHNAGFDLPVGQKQRLWELSIPNEKFECTATMAKLSQNNRLAGLKSLAKELLGESDDQIVTYQEAVKNSEKFLLYAVKDADLTFRLFPILQKELKDKGLSQLYEEVEKPFIKVNIECQTNGLQLDLEKIQEKLLELKSKINSESKILPEGLNWNSPIQLKRFIYGDLGEVVQFLKGKPSTSSKALEKLKGNAFVETILRLKEYKASIQQLEQLKNFTDPNTKRIYPFINPLGADTGRATSSTPNLQNISRESFFRELFIASPGHKLVVLDYSQIEPRVLAHFLPNTEFAKLFEHNGDFYNVLADRFLPNLSGKQRRDTAKQVILAKIYGMSSQTLALTLQISEAEAFEISEKFDNAFPEINCFRQTVIEKARVCGYSTGLLGRRRYINGLNSTNRYDRFSAERQAFNAVIQGSAATLFKNGLNKIRINLGTECKFLNHVHDEVIIEAPELIADEVFKLSKATLENNPIWFSTPLKAEGGVGFNWKEAKSK